MSPTFAFIIKWGQDSELNPAQTPGLLLCYVETQFAALWNENVTLPAICVPHVSHMLNPGQTIVIANAKTSLGPQEHLHLPAIFFQNSPHNQIKPIYRQEIEIMAKRKRRQKQRLQRRRWQHPRSSQDKQLPKHGLFFFYSKSWEASVSDDHTA